jgi:hypothetical protein
MHIIHGTWIPDDTHEFIQRGAFYLWVETDTLQDVSRHDSMHPRHLMHTDLTTFLAEKLGLQVSVVSALSGSPLHTKYFLLPTAEGRPSPSFELLRYVEEEEPLEFVLQPWSICCYQVSDIITTLNDIHFVALNDPEDFQLGADLLFWQQYTQALKTIIAKDQYIPALKYRELPVAPTKANGRRRITHLLSSCIPDGNYCPTRMRRSFSAIVLLCRAYVPPG